jgi:hypothetical protein
MRIRQGLAALDLSFIKIKTWLTEVVYIVTIYKCETVERICKGAEIQPE